MEATQDLVTSGEAATLLGVADKTVRRWANSGHLPVVRTPGGHRRFRRSDVENLLRIPTPEPTKAAS